MKAKIEEELESKFYHSGFELFSLKKVNKNPTLADEVDGT